MEEERRKEEEKRRCSSSSPSCQPNGGQAGAERKTLGKRKYRGHLLAQTRRARERRPSRGRTRKRDKRENKAVPSFRHRGVTLHLLRRQHSASCLYRSYLSGPEAQLLKKRRSKKQNEKEKLKRTDKDKERENGKREEKLHSSPAVSAMSAGGLSQLSHPSPDTQDNPGRQSASHTLQIQSEKVPSHIRT